MKVPTLVLYWVDTKELLSHRERRDLEFSGTLVAVTPLEVLIEDVRSGRKVAVRGVTDPYAPPIPQKG